MANGPMVLIIHFIAMFVAYLAFVPAIIVILLGALFVKRN